MEHQPSYSGFMKIMTLNVWQGRLERVLLKHLETLDIDFACMQEAVDYEGTPAGLASSYKKIGDSLRLDYQFFSPLTAMKLGSKDITFGNVIYAGRPFSETGTIFTRGEYKDNFDFDVDDYNVRAFQHALVEIGDKNCIFSIITVITSTLISLAIRKQCARYNKLQIT